MKTLVNVLITIAIIGIIVILAVRSGRDETGEVVFSITDQTAPMDDITEVRLAIDRIEMHSPDEGWVLVSSDIMEYGLLALEAENRSQLHVLAEVPDGTYDQLRINLASVIVVMDDATEEGAELPAEEVIMDATVVVNEDRVSSVNLDFLADRSLHMTEEDEYVFAPVIRVRTQSNVAVSVEDDDSVTILGGATDTDQAYGMDVDGSVKMDFVLDSSEGIELDEAGVLRLLGTPTVDESALDANGIPNFTRQPEVTVTLDEAFDSAASVLKARIENAIRMSGN